MKSNKRIKSIIVFVFFAIIITLVFWVPNFFIEEFNYISITFSDDSIKIATDPNNLLEKKASRWTDVSATFTNDSNKVCEVVIKSETLNETFSLSPEFQYGLIFPKEEDITVIFCGQEEVIRI